MTYIYTRVQGVPPFVADSEYLTFRKIERLEYTFPPHFPPHGRALVASLLQLDPLARPAADRELKAHASTPSLRFARSSLCCVHTVTGCVRTVTGFCMRL